MKSPFPQFAPAPALVPLGSAWRGSLEVREATALNVVICNAMPQSVMVQHLAAVVLDLMVRLRRTLGANKLGPRKSVTDLLSRPEQEPGSAVLPVVASVIWFWNFKYENRRLCEKVPCDQSTPATCCRVKLLVSYTE